MQSAASPPTRLTDLDNDEDSSEHWITIQRNTFANWVFEQLGGRSAELGLRGSVDLQRDLVDGRLLCVLVEQLQQQRRRVSVSSAARRSLNQHQCIDNISRALRAMTDDGIRLVNIGQFHHHHRRRRRRRHRHKPLAYSASKMRKML